jgi:hypothetical protein
MIVFIDRQHSGNPKRINARGANRDINGDGEITADELEAIWTGRISIELEIRLLDMGIKVIPISDGTYPARHARVNEYAEMHPGPWVYLAMHLNAGGGNYGAYFYDHRSNKGQQLATIMAQELKQACKELEGGARAISAQKGDWTKNAFWCIKGVGRPVAICVEPFFMDVHTSLLSIQGIAKVSTSMAKAIKKWGDQQ